MSAVRCGSRNPEIIYAHQSLESSACRGRVCDSAPIAARRRPLLVYVFMFVRSTPASGVGGRGSLSYHAQASTRCRRRKAASFAPLPSSKFVPLSSRSAARICTVIRTHRAHIRHSRDYLQIPFTSNSVPTRHFTAITCPKFNDVV